MKLIAWLKKERMSIGIRTSVGYNSKNNWEAFLGGYATEFVAKGATPDKAIAKLVSSMAGKEVEEWDFFGHEIVRVIKIPKDLVYDTE